MTVLVCVVARDGVAVASDGLTSSIEPVVSDATKIVRAGSSLIAVLCAGRAQFGGQPVANLITECLNEADTTYSFADIRRLLEARFLTWLDDRKSKSHLTLLIAGYSNHDLLPSHDVLHIEFPGKGSHPRVLTDIPHDSTSVAFAEGGYEGENWVLDYLEDNSSCPPGRDESEWEEYRALLWHLGYAHMSVADVRAACVEAIHEASRRDSTSDHRMIGGLVRGACLTASTFDMVESPART